MTTIATPRKGEIGYCTNFLRLWAQQLCEATPFGEGLRFLICRYPI